MLIHFVSLLPYFCLILFSAIASFFLLQKLIPALSRVLPDDPNYRSSHLKPTPRGGGLSFICISIASSVIALISGQASIPDIVPLLVMPLSVIGLIDDRFNLPASLRFVVQLLTAALLLGFSPFAQQLGFTLVIEDWYSFLLLPFSLLAVTAVINFTNFMDGLDGLVAGCMLLSISCLAFRVNSPWSIWVLAGSLLGFLFCNWSPAKVFMGDVGSTFLGGVFAGLVLQAPSLLESLGYLLVATPLLGDAFLCIPRRLSAGQRVFQAHRLHLFQRLHQAGWSHARVSSTYIVATFFLTVAMLFGGLPWVFSLAVAELFFGFWLDQRIAVPFSVASIH